MNYVLQTLGDTVREAVSDQEKEMGLKVLFKLSQSLAVHHMSSLTGISILSILIIIIFLLYSSLSLSDTLVLLRYSCSTNIAALAVATLTNITMTTTNGVSSSSHVTELLDQVIEALLVGDYRSPSHSLGLHCLLNSLMKLCSVSDTASQSAVNTLLSLLPHISGQSFHLCTSGIV